MNRYDTQVEGTKVDIATAIVDVLGKRLYDGDKTEVILDIQDVLSEHFDEPEVEDTVVPERVEVFGKGKLWHIQFTGYRFDEPYDMFVWSVDRPSDEFVKKLYKQEQEEDLTDDDTSWVNWDIYSVYVDTLNEETK